MKAPRSISESSSDMAETDDSSASMQPKYLTYEEGSILTLKAHSLNNRLLAMRILKVYQPFSLSCVMKVEILHGTSSSDKLPQRAVLKLFDRRFAAKLRNEHRLDVWTSRHEDAYHELVSSGAAIRFMHLLQQPEYSGEPDAGWSDAESETYLQGWCSDMFATELEAYNHLESLQGHQVPRLYSSVSLFVRSPAVGAAHTPNSSSSLLQVPGLLIEHIVGPTLSQMPDFIAPEHWQTIVDTALDTVRILSDRGVINEGVRPANIIVTPTDMDRDRYRVVILDLARCGLRQNNQSDVEWNRLKAEQDEEGSLARAMLAILRKVGYKLQYVPSSRSGNLEGRT